MTTPTPFRKILIANRSEIALRIARTARALGYRTVAVYSDVDADAAHVTGCDEAVHLGATPSAESYLNIGRIIDAARLAGADAVHPGYGFLAENAAFAAACREAGLVFIGPSPEAIAAMGDKARAKAVVREVGVPCIPGHDGEEQDDATLLRAAERVGFPLMIKATAGGGGRGIRRAQTAADFAHALRSARSEATTAFGDARVILERIVASPRHVEVQVFGDRYGRVIHIGERDCSVQRRYQKVVEEAPSPAVDAALREEMGRAAVRVASAIAYEGAGTVEFLLDADGAFYFMEMNTRLQVEHTVTEEITGLDLVELQLRIAAGEPLPLMQQDVALRGHAIQVRLCSEDPRSGFLPQGGRMHLWEPPAGIRVEHALSSGATVAPDYDSMVAKLIAFGRDREEARRKLASALDDLVALGPATNREFLAACLRHPVFAAGAATTAFVDASIDGLTAQDDTHRRLACVIAPALLQTATDGAATDGATTGAAAATARLLPRHPVERIMELDGAKVTARMHHVSPGVLDIEVDGTAQRVAVQRRSATDLRVRIGRRDLTVRAVHAGDELLFAVDGRSHRLRDLSHDPATRGGSASDGRIRALMAGKVVAVYAAAGERVEAGQPVLTLEAMKIEHTLTAPLAGTLAGLHVGPGQQVTLRQVLAEIVVQTTGG
ncbi:MAG: acetyl/propionyl/methylcrotonyl-CoA carboxylase subunit alpha [Gammaproteobacteria bacterium]